MKHFVLGSQQWALGDLRVTNFRNGDKIPVCDPSILGHGLTQPAMCYIQGVAYYNRYALMDSRGLIPAGWEVASYENWKEAMSILSKNGNLNSTESFHGETKVQKVFTYLRGRNSFFKDYPETGSWWTKEGAVQLSSCAGLRNTNYFDCSGMRVKVVKTW